MKLKGQRRKGEEAQRSKLKGEMGKGKRAEDGRQRAGVEGWVEGKIGDA